MNTTDNNKEHTPAEKDSSRIEEIQDLFHYFTVGDEVWYHLKSSYAIKQSKIAEIVKEKPCSRFYLYTRFKLIMENGDETDSENAFHSKKEVMDHLINDVTAKINQDRIALTNTQRHLGELERILNVLQKHASDEGRWEIPVNESEIDYPSLDSSLDVVFIGRSDIMPIADTLWKMLDMPYATFGGMKAFRSKNSFLKMVKYAKVVYHGDVVVACAVYRRLEDRFKMVAIGCNQDYIGKEGLQAIVKDDMVKSDLHFWVEASGAIERYFKKYNCYSMPSTVASKILNKREGLLRLLQTDKVHYERIVAEEWFEKMIFGVNDEEIIQKVLGDVEDYSQFMKSAIMLSEDNDAGLKYNLKQAYYIIDNIYRSHFEDGFNEMVPSWSAALHEAKRTLEAAEHTETIDDYIEYCEYLLHTLPPLELHALNIDNL